MFNLSQLANRAEFFLEKILELLSKNVFILPSMIQIAVIAAAFIFGYIGSRYPRRWLTEYIQAHASHRLLTVVLEAIKNISTTFLVFLFLLVGVSALSLFRKPSSYHIIDIASTLLLAWMVIRFCTFFVQKPVLARWIAGAVWLVVALSITGLLAPTLKQMDAIGIHVGETYISLFTFLKGLVSIIVFIWFANVVSRLTEKKIYTLTEIQPSLQVLFSKIIKITFITLAFIIGLNTFGIDLTALAVLSGAIGVGIGFGLQKVVSNFISGIILLLDNSIKPGDVIVIENTYGWVNSLSARYVSVITRDGKEHLIPNEQLITEKVENWSYTNKNVRIHVAVNIGHENNPHQAIALILQVAEKNARILKYPKPNCLVRAFNPNAIELELRVWIDDPINGIGNIQSDLLLAIWDSFKTHQISFPTPYSLHDIHIRSLPDTGKEKEMVHSHDVGI